MAEGRLFFQNPLVKLHWRGFDDEFVAFDQLSGITYRFDVLRAFLLDVLTQGPRSESSLTLDVSGHLGLTDPSAVPLLVQTILQEFLGAGLVEVTET